MFRSLFAYNGSKHNVIVDKDVTTAEFAIIVVYCRFNIVYVNLIKLDCIKKVCEERAQFPLARLLLYCGDVTDIWPSFTCFAPYCAGIVGCLCAVVSVGYLTPFGYMHFCHGNLLKITDLR